MTTIQELDGLTIVTPSFEGHLAQFTRMVESVACYCVDPEFVTFNIVVERRNVEIFEAVFQKFPILNYRIIISEDVFSDFGASETPQELLKRAGKFAFQAAKKFGGLRAAQTKWSLVLDSEGEFLKPFSCRKLLEDYVSQKYVFYTLSAPRGKEWRKSHGFTVTQNAGKALGVKPSARWYMEYFHWFYETEKVHDLFNNRLSDFFFETYSDSTVGCREFFENILYYTYLEKYHSNEYNFFDFKSLLDEHCPKIGARFILNQLPFSLFGNEYLLNVVGPDEIKELYPIFDRFKLTFVRLEPLYFDPKYVEELLKIPSFVATISSQHMMWLRKKIAVCISGEFRHNLHRTPEQQVRHMLGFLSGVACDVYIHNWSSTTESLIVDELKPKAFRFEPRKNFDELASQIQIEEPIKKPGRDAGSIAMFYGIQTAFDLIEEAGGDYDFVVRIRPDLYFDLSLKEILNRISDNGDFPANAIVFPKIFHSKGVNDLFAIGPTELMKEYCHTYDYVKDNIDNLPFNPELILLQHLLDKNIHISVMDIPIAGLRDLHFRASNIFWAIEHQRHTWWSRTDELPDLTDVTEFFREKYRSMYSLMTGSLPRLLYIPISNGTESPGKEQLLRIGTDDWDPMRRLVGFFWRNFRYVPEPVSIRGGEILPQTEPYNQAVFVYEEGEDLVVSEWQLDPPRTLKNEKVILSRSETRQKIGNRAASLAWTLYRSKAGKRIRSMKKHARELRA